MKEDRVTLGQTYTDSISGFTGVAVSRTEFLHGCVRVAIEPKTLGENGKLMPAEYFDEQRVLPTSKAGTGGPGDAPKAWAGEKK